MKKHVLSRAMLACAAASLMGAAAVQAQQFNFGTRGQFTSVFPGCNDVAGLLSVTCTGGGFTLSFLGVTPIVGNYLNNSTVSLGSLTLSGSGNVTVPASTVNFRLFVDNTVPSPGVGSFSGFITGTVNVGVGIPQFSSLVWNPNATTTADGVSYSLILDAVTGGVNIPANGNVDIRARAVVSTVPEPSSLMLLIAGLSGVVAVGVAGKKKRFI